MKEFKNDGESIYNHLLRIIEKANNIISSFSYDDTENFNINPID